jgi:nucleoside-diphosphate-sugar epimerase
MKFLITGANGFVGRALGAELLRRGHFVRAAVRAADKFSDDVAPVAVGDIDDTTDWSEALRDVEVVIHLAARVHVMRETDADPLAEFRRVNLEGTANLARQAASAGVRRFVYVSSVGVNGLLTGIDQSFSETDVPSPHNAYALSKWEAEQSLRSISAEIGLEVVVVRPPLVYGHGAPGNFAQMMKVLTRGVPLPLDSVRNLRSFVYVGNLSDALIRCATHPAAAGQTYLVSDGEDVSTPDLLRLLGDEMERPAFLFPCPIQLLKLAGRLVGRLDQIERLTGSLRVDSGKLRNELDWTPPFTLVQGLQATADWYRSVNS